MGMLTSPITTAITLGSTRHQLFILSTAYCCISTRFPSSGPSTNQINPPLAATIILADPKATIVTSFNPPDSCLGSIATSKEIAQCVLPYPLSSSYEILLANRLLPRTLVYEILALATRWLDGMG
ncbi:hypothetical protein GH714_042393 [Hevea brasiliensis]|uniref:Uncharacterized protein n=1 Tax=Hevea brasiliensis TaxID=3981 RepID=A0A6A6LNK1_HEVBR|nr:hypothetical protein GH714_042393 [Hevea brasiliensis]